MIHGGHLSPGDCLPPERVLSEMLDVSRSSLREGLAVLRAEGYVEMRRGIGGGTFITELDVAYARWLATMAADSDLLREIIDVRTAVETQIAWLAAERRVDEQIDEMRSMLDVDGKSLSAQEFRDIDSRFHRMLAEAAGSPRLLALMQSARGELFTPASSLLTSSPTIARSHEEHRDIFAAVAAAEPELAATQMRAHLQSTFNDVALAVADSTANAAHS
ncbi:hypothetical protein A5630_21270 [Mycolicibacterium mucogenicum]|uniref:HTH gntR-type domain-containing protein n=2 Tax=Mycolicibacterium mucogenicum TaxID=56689 RepID=A0A1A3H2G5_MYCMU|nr:hypothetical protein A5630_21270 [Mycolicibacterium mucogenicum]